MNENLSKAKQAKNDEFYTQYSDIEAEMNAYVEYDPDVFRGKTILLPCDDPEWSNFTKYFAANFERFGLKKLISTSYAKGAGNEQLTLFELNSPLFDEGKHETRGKLFTLRHDTNDSGSRKANSTPLLPFEVKIAILTLLDRPLEGRKPTDTGPKRGLLQSNFLNVSMYC